MQKIWMIVSKKPTSLGLSAVILMIMVVASGLLGLIKLRLLYERFTPEETDIFFAAFRIPNFLFEILATGALTSTFIPVFTKYITQNRHNEANTIASVMINFACVAVLIISIPLFIWTEHVSAFFAPGFNSAQIHQMAFYTRSMLLLQVLPLLFGNFFTGILQSYRLFLIPSFAPVLYNIGMILGITILGPFFGLYAAVIGVGIGAVLFMLVQVPLIVSLGYKHRFTLNTEHPGIKEMIKLIVPRMVGLGASQIDVTVDLMLSTLLGPKMVTIFTLAQSLQQLPVRLFGGTISQAALPVLSEASAREDRQQYKESVMSAYRMIFFLIIPTAIFFIVLRIPLIRLIFGAARFDWESTVLTAYTLSAFSISLFAQSLSQVFTRGFYAIYDSKTPVVISLCTVAINTICSVVFVLVFHWPVWSLGLSTSIASILNAFAQIVVLYIRVGGFHIDDILIHPLKVFLVASISGMVIYIPLKLLDQLVFDTTRVFSLLLLTGITGGIGILTYLFLSWVIGIREVNILSQFIAKIERLRLLLVEPREVAQN